MAGKRWALLIAWVACQATAGAATITFATDPFAGSTALTTPGRQVVGGELFTTFDPATDVFAFDLDVFGVAPPLVIANDVIGGIPATGPNLIVLQTFDDDASAATPFGAGNAANLIAAQITSPGAGFFIYFNSGLDLPRLVFSTDLSDSTADLRILARLTNLTGQPGRDALATLTEPNFAVATPRTLPEAPAWLLLMAGGLGLVAARARPRRALSGARASGAGSHAVG